MTTILHVEKMHCDACARRVTKAVEQAAPGATVAVDLAAGRVTVQSAGERQADAAAIAAAVTAAGYPARPQAQA